MTYKKVGDNQRSPMKKIKKMFLIFLFSVNSFGEIFECSDQIIFLNNYFIPIEEIEQISLLKITFKYDFSRKEIIKYYSFSIILLNSNSQKKYTLNFKYNFFFNACKDRQKIVNLRKEGKIYG